MSEKRVNIKITASTSGFDSAIKKAQKQIEDLQFSLDNANLLSLTLQNQLTETSQTLENASNSLKKSEHKLEVLKWSLIIGVPTSFIAGMMIGLACQRR